MLTITEILNSIPTDYVIFALETGVMKKQYRIYNRISRSMEPEVSGNISGLAFLYRSLPGRLVTPVLTRKVVSQTYARYMKSRRSAGKIKSFIRQYNIQLSDVLEPLESFKSLNAFFVRQLKPHARMIDTNPAHLISPADARLLVFDLSRQNSLPVKGYWYSLDKFIRDKTLAGEYHHGWCFIYRLAPCDYHRFCYVDKGVQDDVRRIRGILHSVNPIALKKVNSLMAKNYRELTILHTQNFGKVLHFEVGALMVGKVMLHNRSISEFERGQEKGWFEFGGSTIVQLFAKTAVKPDADILQQSADGIETLVRMGEKVGIKPE